MGVAIPLHRFNEHCSVAGASGTGKSYLLSILAAEHWAAGYSVVSLDPKLDSIELLYGITQEAKLLVPSMQAPGWNPLLGDLPADAAASAVMETLKALVDSGSAPRMANLLKNVLVVLAVTKGSIADVVPFLSDASLRQQLLKATPPPRDRAAFKVAYDFFTTTYNSWSAQKQQEAIDPITYRISEILRNDFLSRVLCTSKNEVDLRDLWRYPSALLTHLDEPYLGSDATKLFGTLASNCLFATARRAAHRGKVLAVVDEVGLVKTSLGDLAPILDFARGSGLRMILATQHINQLPTELQGSVFGNCGVFFFFRLGAKDAPDVKITVVLVSDENR